MTELWPTKDATCPKCHGAGEIYYLNAKPGPQISVVGGKRIPCPSCAGSGSVRELIV